MGGAKSAARPSTASVCHDPRGIGDRSLFRFPRSEDHCILLTDTVTAHWISYEGHLLLVLEELLLVCSAFEDAANFCVVNGIRGEALKDDGLANIVAYMKTFTAAPAGKAKKKKVEGC